jgi:hypothetical protein
VHEAILPPGAAAVAHLLSEWRAMDQVYLADGTALALHLGHRQSCDPHFLTRTPLARPPLSRIGIGFWPVSKPSNGSSRPLTKSNAGWTVYR